MCRAEIRPGQGVRRARAFGNAWPNPRSRGGTGRRDSGSFRKTNDCRYVLHLGIDAKRNQMMSLFSRLRGEPLRLRFWSWTIIGTAMGWPVGAGAQLLLPPDDAGPPDRPLPVPDSVSIAKMGSTDARVVADRYGFAHWDEVQTLAFSLDLQLNPTRRIQREWVWDVKAGRATIRFEKEGAWVEESFDLAGPLATPEDVRNHQRFTYDTYWLLFPFQLMWSNPQVTNEGEQFSAVPGSTVREAGLPVAPGGRVHARRRVRSLSVRGPSDPALDLPSGRRGRSGGGSLRSGWATTRWGLW